MAKRFTDEEFRQFVVDQFMGVREDVGALRNEVGLARREFNEFRVEAHGGFKDVRDDIKEVESTLAPLSQAFDRDAEKLDQLERRVVRVEKQLGLGRA